VRVTDYGARGDGITDDTLAIAAAIRLAARIPGSRVFFARGTYRLKHSPGGELLALKGISDLSIQGDGALLRCDTPKGTTSIFKLTDCENITIEGLAFRDEGGDRAVNSKGAVAIYLTGYGRHGNRRIEIKNCSFDNMLSALMVSDGGGKRAIDIRLADLDIRSGYYGLNFQNNGDDVFATGIRCNDVKRSYFPYGVTRHHVELTADNNATGFTDVLIKCYGRETANLTIKLRSRGKRSGDAIVAFDQQHPDDLGVIRDIRIDLDIADADCRLNNIVLLRAFTPDGEVLPKTHSQWRNIEIKGQANYCNGATRLLTVGSQPGDPGTIAMSEALLKQLDMEHLRGFKIVLAGVPGRIGQP
jgi:hypothetical protein